MPAIAPQSTSERHIHSGVVTPEPPAGPRSGRVRRPRAPWWLWLAAVVVIAPVAVPLVYLFLRVTSAGDVAIAVIGSSRTWELMARTAWLVASVTAGAVTLGVAVAWITTRTDLRARRTWSTLMALPLVVPSYVLALTALAAAGEQGVISQALAFVGLPPLPPVVGFWGAWLTLTLATYPYVHLLVSATLRGLDPSLEEAARSLGASPRRVFTTIVLPQLRPPVAAAGLLVALYTLSDFGAVSLLRYDVFTRAIYAQYAGRTDRTPALVLAGLLIGLTLLVLYAEQRTRGSARLSSARPSRPPRVHVLTRRQRTAATAVLVAVLGLALGGPVLVLGTWTLRGIRGGQSFPGLVEAAIGSLSASGLAGIVAVVAAVPVAVLVVRFPSRAGHMLDRTVWAIYALPHITVGLAVVSFAARFARPVYQSLGLLVLTYVVIFLPQASGAGQAALARVDPALEEASRSLGRTSWETLLRITVPLMARGLLAGGALVFLTAMKELPATLLLRPTGFDTLAVRIWSAAAEGFYARAGAAALVLLVIASVPMFLLTTRESRHG